MKNSKNSYWIKTSFTLKMFNLEDFKDSLILEKVDKLNNHLSKNKIEKISKIIRELENLLDEQKCTVPITYILSILAENKIDLITERLIQKIEVFLHSEDVKLRINSIIIIGFAMLANSKYIEKYSQKFVKFLKDKSEDTRNNAHYFLQELIKKHPILVNSDLEIILESLLTEKKKDNIISLLNFLESFEDLEFDLLYDFRNIAKSLIASFEDKKSSKIYIKLVELLKKNFPLLSEIDLETQESKSIIKLLENQFLMKKHNFSLISKNSDLNLKEYLKKFAKSNLKEKKVYFYIKSKENLIYIYELEKDKLKTFFEQGKKISDKIIYNRFSQVIDDDSELKIFIKTLNRLKIIDGYYSDIGFFYSYVYIKSNFVEDLQINGSIDLMSYNFLPQNFIDRIIKDISKSLKITFLKRKDQETYISLKKIQHQINLEAAKGSIIDLKSYRQILLDEDFIRLIKNLPREYLSKFRKGTQWLTNLGSQKIRNEVQNSKIVGYFDISRISEDLNIGELLLLDIFDQFVDYRSGIWDRKKETFYYSKYINDKINELSTISDEGEKLRQIEKISKELNIDKKHILSKIDENLQSIGEEIKEKDKIKISEYLEKTGMEAEYFLKFIDELGISYFKKADLLIFNPKKIEDAKNDIKYMLIDKSKSNEYISLGTYDITSNLIEGLIHDLIADGKLKGIFHENEGEILFYTERGIRNLMLENSFLFSFHDLFYGKELNQTEIEFLREIFDDLIKKRRIKGSFDEETLTFSSDDVIFAKDYNTVVFEFEKMVNNYTQKFETEFERIKKILIKEQETIYPQEIKIIQETIDKINDKSVYWRSGLESFIRRTNKKLLRDQGISVKKYKTSLSKEKKEEIMSLEEDSEVHELLNNFNGWIKLFNKLELKYPNVIFYQKRLINNLNNKESKNKLSELLIELNLV
ncbi:MAG: hypothetical protein HWN81_07725 [Candidatus Lokiarchaeota archaeon]|nr:hypothetical protein [Candidatus Lokiarchaeota archaeon]